MTARMKMKIHAPAYWPVVVGIQDEERIVVIRLLVLNAIFVIAVDMGIEAIDVAVAVDIDIAVALV